PLVQALVFRCANRSNRTVTHPDSFRFFTHRFVPLIALVAANPSLHQPIYFIDDFADSKAILDQAHRVPPVRLAELSFEFDAFCEVSIAFRRSIETPSNVSVTFRD